MLLWCLNSSLEARVAGAAARSSTVAQHHPLAGDDGCWRLHEAGGDGERRGGGEARDHRHGDEVYQEAEPEERSQSEASFPAVDQSELSIHLRRPHARMMRPDRKARRMA